MDSLAQENEQLKQHNLELQQRLTSLQQEEKRLTGSLQHCRAWSATLSRNLLLVENVFCHSDDLKPPRRIYVGSLPADTTDAELRQFIKDLMTDRGATCYNGSPVTACKVYPEKNYAFVEFRNVEEASNLMAFDGLVFKDSHLRIRRPNNYVYDLAETLGPTQPNPTIDLSGLDMVRTVVQDSDNKLFIGGLPCEWPEDQVKAELAQFGKLKAFNLVMDKSSGNSRGYAFCEYVDAACTDAAINSLNSRSINRRTLTVKRAKETAQPARPQHSTTGPAAVARLTAQTDMPSSQVRAQGMPQGLSHPQHSAQSMPQASIHSMTQDSQRDMQSMTQSSPQAQHSTQSTPVAQLRGPSTHTVPPKGLHESTHSRALPAQSISPNGLHHSQFRPSAQLGFPLGTVVSSEASPNYRGRSHPRDYYTPQGPGQGTGVQGRRGFYVQQRHPRDSQSFSRSASASQQ